MATPDNGNKRKGLRVVDNPPEEGLGLATIMDRSLASKHGVPYVHLAAFCIDVDRVSVLVEDDPTWPFGWEVFLTEYYLCRELGTDHRELMEDVGLGVLEEASRGPVLGAQYLFALYNGVRRKALPEALSTVFAGWQGAPGDLIEDLDSLWNDADAWAKKLSARMLECAVEPPLAPPVKMLLQGIAER